MKIFIIQDDENQYGYLYYESLDDKAYIFLTSKDYWALPMILDYFKDSPYGYVDSFYTKKWVSSRIIPSERQNIVNILKENHLKEYNEMLLLFLNKGVCPQDEAYIKELDKEYIPNELLSVFQYRMTDFIPLSLTTALVVFENGIVKKIDMTSILNKYPDMGKNLFNMNYMDLFHLDVSGFELCIKDVYRIPFYVFYEEGVDTGISEPELSFFEKRHLISTSEAEEMLCCSRQNLDSLVKREILHPVYDFNRIRMFKKSEIKTYLERKR